MNTSTGGHPTLPHDGSTTALAPLASELSRTLPVKAHESLLRMFSDPYLLQQDERGALVSQLRELSARYPASSNLRVLLGMALCVNLEPQAAIDELSEAVKLAPDSFIAQLKLGELWMRLRICDKAEAHTHEAALLADSPAQSELARRQAALIRTMRREGVERGGYQGAWRWLFTALARLRNRTPTEAGEASVALDLG